MYISQDIANRIKLLLRNQNKNMKDMLTTLGLGINTISQLAKGQVISSFKLAIIADYLDCSVDYLLGRTEDEHLRETHSILKKYNELNTMGQIKVDSYIDGLLENPYYQSTDTSSSSEPEYVNRGRAIAYGGMAEETKLTAEQDKRLHELLRQKKKESENKK